MSKKIKIDLIYNLIKLDILLNLFMLNNNNIIITIKDIQLLIIELNTINKTSFNINDINKLNTYNKDELKQFINKNLRILLYDNIR